MSTKWWLCPVRKMVCEAIRQLSYSRRKPQVSLDSFSENPFFLLQETNNFETCVHGHSGPPATTFTGHCKKVAINCKSSKSSVSHAINCKFVIDRSSNFLQRPISKRERGRIKAISTAV